MSGVIEELIYKLGFAKVSTRELDEAEKEARLAAKRMADSFKKAGRDITSGMKTIAGVVLGAATGLGLFVDRTTAAADEIAKTARAMGMSSREFQRMSFAATRSGVEITQLRQATLFLNKNMLEAAQGGGKAFTDTLKTFGLSLQELKEASPEERFGIIADALQRVADPAQRASLAAKYFGEEAGPRLASLLADGSRGITALGDEAESLGRVLSDEVLGQAEEFQDRLADLKAQLFAVSATAASDLLPAIREIILETGKWVRENKNLIREKVSAFAEQLVKAVRTLIEVVKSLVSVASELTNVLGPSGLVLAVSALAASMGSATGVVVSFFAAFEAGKSIGEAFTSDLQKARKSGDELLLTLKQIENLSSESEKIDALRQQERRIQAQLNTRENPGALQKTLRALGAGGIFNEIQDRSTNLLREQLENTRVQIRLAEMRARDPEGAARLDRERRRTSGPQYDEPIGPAAPGITVGTLRGGGGGGAAEKRDRLAAIEQAKRDFLPELERLAALNGLSAGAVQASIEAAADSIQRFDKKSVQRNAALGRLGSSAGKDFTARTSDPLLSMLLGEDVPDVELSAIARGADPQVLISNITNNFEFNNEFDIDGTGDPQVVGVRVAEQLRDAFQGSIEKATKTAKVVFAR